MQSVDTYTKVRFVNKQGLIYLAFMHCQFEADNHINVCLNESKYFYVIHSSIPGCLQMIKTWSWLITATSGLRTRRPNHYTTPIIIFFFFSLLSRLQVHLLMILDRLLFFGGFLFHKLGICV